MTLQCPFQCLAIPLGPQLTYRVAMKDEDVHSCSVSEPVVQFPSARIVQPADARLDRSYQLLLFGHLLPCQARQINPTSAERFSATLFETRLTGSSGVSWDYQPERHKSEFPCIKETELEGTRRIMCLPGPDCDVPFRTHQW